MDDKVMRVLGTALAVSPISHGEILAQGEKKPNVIGFRKLPIICGNKRIEIPVISGNSVRGIGRRVLFDEMLATLDIELSELIKKKTDRRLIWFFLRVGGTTEKGDKASPTHYSVYVQLQDTIPTLGLLGGVYKGHHFESTCRIGFMIPLIKETVAILGDIYKGTSLELSKTEEDFPAALDIEPFPIRYMRKKEPGLEEDSDTEAGLFGAEVLPIGTQFVQTVSLTADAEMHKKAFKAMLALITRRGIVGGMSSKGHGAVLMKYKGITEDSIEDFNQYIRDHKNEITDAIQSIPELLKWTNKEEEKNNKKKGQKK